MASWARHVHQLSDMADNAKRLDDEDNGLSPALIAENYGEFRRLLMSRRTEVLKHSNAERAELSEQQLTSPGDVGDVAVVDTSADYFLKLADNDRRELIEIRDAFSRMQRGVYGLCENCENPIAIERLRRLPQARRCIDCQSLFESKYRASHANPSPKL